MNKPYPLRHFEKHPLLAMLVMLNYQSRKNGAPDEWYWADRLLMEKTSQ